jgi:hypothetical protein
MSTRILKFENGQPSVVAQSLAVPRQEMSAACTRANSGEDKCVVAGGLYSKAVFVYTHALGPTAGTTVRSADLPMDVRAAAMGAASGVIVLAGGHNTTWWITDGFVWNASTAETNYTAHTPKALSVARWSLGAATLSDRYVLFLGGSPSGKNAIDKYDIVSGVWSASPATLTASFSSAGVVSYMNRAIICGGPQNAVCNMITETQGTISVKTMPSLSFARGLPGAARLSTYAIFGGGCYQGNCLLPTSYLDIYDFGTESKVACAATMLTGVNSSSPASIGGENYAVIYGGRQSASPATYPVQGTLFQWTGIGVPLTTAVATTGLSTTGSTTTGTTTGVVTASTTQFVKIESGAVSAAVSSCVLTLAFAGVASCAAV